jgi:hypothetical protein
MKYKKLICFDFDATLFHTALEDEGKVIWKEKTGYDYPYKGWWSKPETLDLKIFDTPLNKPVYSEYLKAVSDSDNFVILATGRIERLRPQVEAILNKNNLSFDGVFLKRGPGDTFYFKRTLFETLINDLKPEEFIMYDDREEHLVEFKEWAKTMPCDVTIIDVVSMTTTKIKNK